MKKKKLSMMRTLSVLSCMLWTLNIVAQDATTFFSCSQIKKDYEEFAAIKKANKRSTKKWDEAILKYHPLENGNIQYTYIIEAPDTFNIRTMMNNTRSFFGTITSSELASIKNIDEENYIIEAATGVNNVGEASGYGSISVVGVVMNFRVSFKKIGLSLMYGLVTIASKLPAILPRTNQRLFQ